MGARAVEVDLRNLAADEAVAVLMKSGKTPCAAELRCHGAVQLGFVLSHSGKITRVATGSRCLVQLGWTAKKFGAVGMRVFGVAGTWAAENGLEAGDEETRTECCSSFQLSALCHLAGFGY